MKIIKLLMQGVKNLLNFIFSIYAVTGPGRQANALAEVCESLAQLHKHLTNQLKDVDEQLRSAQQARFALPSLKLALAGVAKGKPVRQPQQQIQQLLQQQQQHQNMSPMNIANQHSQLPYAGILMDIANLDTRISTLKHEREDLETRLEKITRQLQKITKKG